MILNTTYGEKVCLSNLRMKLTDTSGLLCEIALWSLRSITLVFAAANGYSTCRKLKLGTDAQAFLCILPNNRFDDLHMRESSTHEIGVWFILTSNSEERVSIQSTTFRASVMIFSQGCWQKVPKTQLLSLVKVRMVRNNIQQCWVSTKLEEKIIIGLVSTLGQEAIHMWPYFRVKGSTSRTRLAHWHL